MSVDDADLPRRLPADEDIMTTAEVAQYLRVSKRTVERMRARGELPMRPLGRSYYISRSRFLALFEPPA